MQVLHVMKLEATSLPNTGLIHSITLEYTIKSTSDSYRNLVPDEYTATKDFCNDLSKETNFFLTAYTYIAV